MEALKKVEEEVLAVEHEIEAQLVTHNTVGSVTIPSTPPLAVSAPYLLLLGLMMGAMALTDRAIRQRTPVKIVTREFRTFQRSYINVYLCALGAEWLQAFRLILAMHRHQDQGLSRATQTKFLALSGNTFFFCRSSLTRCNYC